MLSNYFKNWQETKVKNCHRSLAILCSKKISECVWIHRKCNFEFMIKSIKEKVLLF